jgi:hypothetical protein
MFTLNKLVIIMLTLCFLFATGVVQADTVKLKNGSYFDGRIVEDTGLSVRMQVNVGVVEFKKDDVEEMTLADAEENAAIERLWGLSKDAPDAVSEDLVDAYLHEGKVKYQGRWISQDVYDVIKKEQEIKEKRYRFLQEKEYKERMKEQYQTADDDIVTQQAPSVLQSGPLPFSQKYKTFGKSSVAGNKTDVIATTHTQEERLPIAEDTTVGFTKVKKLGADTTKTIATTTDPYVKEDM